MVAAVQNGADSVYLGCGELNARRGAKNFTAEQLPQAVDYCHIRGVKVYQHMHRAPWAKTSMAMGLRAQMRATLSRSSSRPSYADLLREDRLPTSRELDRLALAFSRDGFTDAYWQGRPGPQMFGVRSESAPDPFALFQEARNAYNRRRPHGRADGRAGRTGPGCRCGSR